MPTYVYECPGCSGRYEAQQSIKDEPHNVCELCKSSRPERVITNTSFVLKGGGWYKDGYGSKAPSEG